MAHYINIGNAGFRRAREGEYVDKSMLIPFINGTIGTEQCMTCVTRARRFGKSMAAKMLCAYYDQSCESRELFQDLKVAADESFEKHLNRYPVIYLDMTDFSTKYKDRSDVVSHIKTEVESELLSVYSDVQAKEHDDLMDVLLRIVEQTNRPFICIIDEWDALCREQKGNSKLLDEYVNLLRRLFKTSNTDRVFAAVYMTGILPMKRYNTQSALNNFEEYTMLSPAQLAGYFGFTDQEVKVLCGKYGADAEEMKRWYDGYQMGDEKSIYNPFAVIKAARRGKFESYWVSTNVFEGLRRYITMDFDGLRAAIVRLIAGGRERIDPLRFSNDMYQVESKDDVLTVLCHLGYLCYDNNDDTVYVPNHEVQKEFERTLRDTGWTEVIRAIENSEQLLQAIFDGDGKRVAEAIDMVHAENASVLKYNDENSLACVLSLAFYAARNKYQMIRELPTGLGFADLVLLPKKGVDSPAIMLELKWNKSADTAIRQMRDKRYAGMLKNFAGEVLAVGVNYDKKSKKHGCKIEKMSLNCEDNCENDRRSNCENKLTDRQEIILEMIRRDSKETARHIAVVLRVGQRTIESDISVLRNGGYITKLTKNPRSPWVVLKKNQNQA